MNKLAEQFRNLNPRDPGAWPPLPKALLMLGLFVVILVVAYFADWQNQIDDLNAGRGKEQTLKASYVEKKAKAINLDLYTQQLREIHSSTDALLKQLPNKSEMAALLVEINQAGLGRGLQFDLFKPAQAEIMHGFYAETPIQIRVNGAYHDMGQFASDIGQLSRIVTLNDMSLAAGKDASTLTMDATAKTFRYLDEDELAAQRKAASKSGKAAKK